MSKIATDLEQSKVLDGILPAESADMHYVLIDTDENKYDVGVGNYIGVLPHYPAWSLAALLEYLKSKAILEIEIADSFRIETDYYNDEEGKTIHPIHSVVYESEDFVDACVEMIVKLHEEE